MVILLQTFNFLVFFYRGTTSLQQVVKAMYTIVYAKVRINGNKHGEVMSIIGVKYGCPLAHTTLLVH